jgi:hypothetical protein
MHRHRLLLQVLVLSGIIVFAFFLAVQYRLIAIAIEADRSFLSLAILVLYVSFSLHWLRVAWHLSHESAQAVYGTEKNYSHNMATLTRQLFGDLDQCAGEHQVEQLLSLYYDQLMNRHALGHFSTELLLRLGLLGTIVGFILMLLPLAEIKEFEPAVMQQLLASMSGGMAVALYTTMAGLITSTLLRYQYHILDTAAVNLANQVAVQVHRGRGRVSHEA